MNTKNKDRIFCDSLKEYQTLKEETTFFKKSENSEIFMIAMSLGFNGGIKTPLKKGKEGLARLDYFKEEHISMMKSIAVMDAKNVEILTNEEEIYCIAEEYANTGIRLLKGLKVDVDSSSFVKKLAAQLLDILNNFKHNK